MTETSPPRKTRIVRASDRTRENEESMSHPLNPRSQVHGHSLSDVIGLQRMGVHILRVPPGKESFAYHRHFGEEEFLYVLSGRGVAEIEGEDHEVGPGDFLGFPIGVAHHLRNPFEEDLVYLSGGERHPLEVAEFPGLGKYLVRVGMTVSLVTGSKTDPFPGVPPLPGIEPR
jgi:uncharacterized cupin superfamily protein